MTTMPEALFIVEPCTQRVHFFCLKLLVRTNARYRAGFCNAYLKRYNFFLSIIQSTNLSCIILYVSSYENEMEKLEATFSYFNDSFLLL